MKQHLYIINSPTEQPLQSLIHYFNSQFSKHNKLTIVPSIFQIANTKQTITPLKYPKQEIVLFTHPQTLKLKL